MTWFCLACLTRHEAHASWCLACGEAGYIVRRFGRVPAAVDGVAEETDARSLAASVWGSVSCAAFPDLKLGPGALVVVHGGPGSGKSTWVTRALDTLAGPVLLVSLEEPPGPTLGARLARCAVKRADFGVVGRASVDQIATIAARRRAVGLVIDSVQIGMFSPRDLRHLLAVLPDLQVLFAVSQQNKQGTVAGRLDLTHEADVVVRLDGGEWSVEKSRYQPVDEASPARPTSSPVAVSAEVH